MPRVFYTDQFVLPLPEAHRFPMSKYSMLRANVAGSGWAVDMCVPQTATDEQLGAAHDDEYVERVRTGELTRQEVRVIGFPWSPGMVERSRRSVGATIEASRSALDDGIAVSLAGGTHHAFRDRGEGFCVFNDSVVAARVLREEGRLERVAVIDCDVHQGNGTAALCASDPSVFTFSIHGARNYPYRKEVSDLDLALEDGTGDASYLDALGRALEEVFESARPQLVIYLAGADPWEGDRWGRLGLSKEGLASRDRLVLARCREATVPAVVTMAGGYAPRVEDTVDIHFRTVRTACELHGAA